MRLDLFRSLWGWQGDWARCAAELEAKARRHENTRPPLQGNRAL